MKHSEAVTLIADFLDFQADSDSSLHAYNIKKAEELLVMLELNGFYPPCRRDGKLDWDPE